MALVRDSDTSLWLHNKLGSSTDLWLGGSICSQLNQDVLRNIRECFIELQPQVKLKLLLSFLHIPRRNVEQWKVELEEILEVALVDSDQWVSMLAELLKTYPGSGLLNFQIEENASVFTDVVNDLRKLVRKQSDQGLLPLECLYLNRNALMTVVGQLPPSTKHFTLKQKPKSATLRAELAQKSTDVVLNLRKSTTTSSVPIRCRGLIKPLGDSTPLKGIPSRLLPNAFKSSPLSRLNSSPANRVLSRPPPSGRKDGGIKLLAIDEQPMGYGRDAKRRKRITEENAEARKDKEGAPAAVSQASTTPDYAVGLLSTSQITATTIPVIATTGTPNYLPPTPGANLPATPAPEAAMPVSVTALTTVPPKLREVQPQPLVEHLPEVAVVTPTPEPPHVSTVIHATTIGTLASLGGSSLQMQQQRVAFQQHQPQQQQLPIQQTIQVVQPHMHAPVIAQPQPAKKLSLTKEQMQEAQDMFTNSNKVTRPEKALILGFIAGSRDNPCPHLGQIVTIMLSENEEKIQQTDGAIHSMIVETHFQMNYTTGEWKRVKKYRRKDS